MSSLPRSVLILGAQGRFGAAAVHAFAAAGWQVLAQMRHAPAEPLPRGARPLVADLADPAAGAALAQAAAGAEVLVYAVNPPYTAWREQLLPLARRGMDLAERLGARFLLPGNVYNYGEGMPALLREDTPERPSSVKGRLRVALEQELAARATQGLRSTVIRAGDFFGSGRGSWLDLAVAKWLAGGRRSGRWVYPGPLDVPHAWAYLPDLAQAFVAVAERPAAAPFERLHFAGHTLTGAELLDALDAAALELGLVGAPPARGGMPWGLIRAGGLFVPIWRELSEMAYLWRVPHGLDGAALAQRVGSVPHTPIGVALRRSLAALAPSHATQARSPSLSTGA